MAKSDALLSCEQDPTTLGDDTSRVLYQVHVIVHVEALLLTPGNACGPSHKLTQRVPFVVLPALITFLASPPFREIDYIARGRAPSPNEVEP